MNCYIPVDTAKRAIGAYLRLLRTIGTIDPAIIQSPIIADEILVDLIVRSRLDSRDRSFTRLEHHVAALRAARTNRSSSVELPRSRLVQKIFREERSNWAEIDNVPCPDVGHVLPFELSNQRTITALTDVEHGV